MIPEIANKKAGTVKSASFFSFLMQMRYACCAPVRKWGTAVIRNAENRQNICALRTGMTDGESEEPQRAFRFPM